MSERAGVSVVVSTKDRPVELRACLESIRQAASDQDEIIVVDSASRDADAIREVSSAAGAHLMRVEQGGSARARNIGIQAATREIVSFTDDDAVVERNWLEAIADGFSDRAVGVVVGPVFEMGSYPPKLLLQYRGFDASRDAVTFSRSIDHWFERLNLGAIGSGANLAVRRSVFDDFGLFREGLGQGAPIPGDENYFLFSVVHSGVRVFNQPSAIVYHPRQSGDRLQELRRGSIAYLSYVALTHPYRLPWLVLWFARRSGRRRRALVQGSGGAAPRWLPKAVANVPGLLLASWRFSRKR